MKKTPKIIIISGPSGSGKDTIIKGIMKKFPNLVMIKSYTTRPKRKSDEVGNRYFVSKEQFQKMIKHYYHFSTLSQTEEVSISFT